MLKKTLILGLLLSMCSAQDLNQQISTLNFTGIDAQLGYSKDTLHIFSVEDLSNIAGNRLNVVLHWTVTPEQQDNLNLPKYLSLELYAIELSRAFIEQARIHQNCKVIIRTPNDNISTFEKGDFAGAHLPRNILAPFNLPDHELNGTFELRADDEKRIPSFNSEEYPLPHGRLLPNNISVIDALDGLSRITQLNIYAALNTIKSGYAVSVEIDQI